MSSFGVLQMYLDRLDKISDKGELATHIVVLQSVFVLAIQGERRSRPAAACDVQLHGTPQYCPKNLNLRHIKNMSATRINRRLANINAPSFSAGPYQITLLRQRNMGAALLNGQNIFDDLRDHRASPIAQIKTMDNVNSAHERINRAKVACRFVP